MFVVVDKGTIVQPQRGDMYKHYRILVIVFNRGGSENAKSCCNSCWMWFL